MFDIKNLSPILFSLFLIDLTQFVSKRCEGLNLLTDEIHSVFDNEDIEIHFKLYLLLYADDTVIFQRQLLDYKKLLMQCKTIVTLGNLKFIHKNLNLS